MGAWTDLGSRFQRPTLKTALAAGAVFLVLLALGSWQVQRLVWKSRLIEDREARAEVQAVPLPGAIADPAAWDYRRVTLSGRFLHEHEMLLGARSLNGNVGYHLVTPLAEPGGRILLVDRGWIPLDKKDAATRAAGNPEGPVTIQGVFRVPPEPNWLTPDNAPDENFWYWFDIPAMAAHTGLTLAPFYVEAGDAPNPGGFPIGGQTRIALPNDHLQYAITWYALAIAFAVIVLVYHRRKPGEGHGR